MSTPRDHVLLLTGAPGIGKTTVIREVAERLHYLNLGGFYTEELREAARRVGFRLVSFAGTSATIAHVAFSHKHQVGKYGVDVATIDAAAHETLSVEPGTDVYLVDEIGKMECLSTQFVAAMRALLESDKIVLATIGKKGGGYMEDVKRRSDAELWEITQGNRNLMPDRIVEWLDAHRPA